MKPIHLVTQILKQTSLETLRKIDFINSPNIYVGSAGSFQIHFLKTASFHNGIRQYDYFYY